MFVNALQLPCYLLLNACSWGSGYFQVTELYARKLEARPSAYTTQAHLYILDNAKSNSVSEIYFSSGCIDKYILIPGRYLTFISKI